MNCETLCDSYFETVTSQKGAALRLEALSDDLCSLWDEESPLAELILAFGTVSHRSSADWAGLEAVVIAVVARAKEKYMARISNVDDP